MAKPSLRITGSVRPGADFQFTAKPTNQAPAAFAALLPDELRVAKRAADIFGLPDATPVLAHRHGQWRTDGFATTVGELKARRSLPKAKLAGAIAAAAPTPH